MSDAHDRLLNEILSLPYYARAALADALLDSLKLPPRPETEAQYENEILCELEELDTAA